MTPPSYGRSKLSSVPNISTVTVASIDKLLTPTCSGVPNMPTQPVLLG